MVWTVGQPPGPDRERATRSRGRWLELRDAAGIWVAECGSVHVARRGDEDAVLREFAAAAPALGVACEYLSAREAARFPALNPNGLKGALFSPAELAVNPPEALARLPHFLAERFGAQLRLGSAVTRVEMPEVRTAADEAWHADRVFVCSGTDFETLFPEVPAASGIRLCKLQMMRTRPQPGGWRLGPHVPGGLTLCHYSAFEVCDTLPALKARVAAEMPGYVRFGIHAMAAQHDTGEVVIGDSHEYGADITPFDRPEVDALILDYLREMIRLPDWEVAARWHGVYAKHPEKPFVTEEPQPGCVVAVAPGGAGMTLAFGIAQEWWEANGG